MHTERRQIDQQNLKILLRKKMLICLPEHYILMLTRQKELKLKLHSHEVQIKGLPINSNYTTLTLDKSSKTKHHKI